jgi:hypothetical protein
MLTRRSPNPQPDLGVRAAPQALPAEPAGEPRPKRKSAAGAPQATDARGRRVLGSRGYRIREEAWLPGHRSGAELALRHSRWRPKCAAECPHVLALVQGHLCATQRDFVANVRSECRACPITARIFLSRTSLRSLPRWKFLLGDHEEVCSGCLTADHFATSSDVVANGDWPSNVNAPPIAAMSNGRMMSRL